MGIEVYPLGAGQEVGRSCIILNIDDKTIMLDCGLHMTFQDQRRFPDFKKIPPNSSGKQQVDLVLITHFHLDHCGALPYFTEISGYSGPVVMTMPTKALLPYMLEDYRKVWTDTQGITQKTQQQSQIQQTEIEQPQLYNNFKLKDTHSFPSRTRIHFQYIIKNKQNNVLTGSNQQMLWRHKLSMEQKQKPIMQGIYQVKLNQTSIKGACMFYIKYNGQSVVYTGDFNSLSDRHLGAAYIDRLEPDLIISESTYATTIRDTKRTRERNFLMHVQEILDNGGKVLIPCFALGRAQELSVLLDSYWNRTQNKYGLYFAAGLIQKANQYYKLFVSWESEKIQDSFDEQNIFDFKHIQPFDRQLIKSQDPMVLLATPGMLHGGLSMQVFKEWCISEKNSLVIPGFCVAGTLGNKLLQGVKKVKIDNKEYEVKMNVQNMSFSAHADSKGIIALIKHLQPKNVMFVHGEAQKMKTLGKLIEEQMGLPVFCPENFQLIKIQTLKLEKQFTKFMMPEDYFKNLKNENKLKAIYIQSPKCDIPNSIIFSSDQLVEEVKQIIQLISGSYFNPTLNNLGSNIPLKQALLKRYLLSNQQNKSNHLQLREALKSLNDPSIEDQISQIEFSNNVVWIPYDLDNQTQLQGANKIKAAIDNL